MIAFAWRKHATTIVLSVLAVAGAVIVAKVERGSVTTEESEARKRNLLEVWRDEAVTELSVTARGKTAKLWRGEADDDGERPWLVEIGGQRYAADPQTVDQYLGSLELGVFERRVPPESVDRAVFKLADPRVAISLTMDGTARRVVIGGEAPTPPGAAYAEVDGRGVVVITAQLRSAFDVDPESFRARGVAPYLALELAALHLEGEGGPRRLERASWSASRGPAFRFDGSGSFGKARVGQAAVDKLLFALGGLQAEEFLSGDQAAKVSTGRVTLTLVPSDRSKPRAVIEVGAACPEKEDLVAAVRREPSPLAACVPKSVMDALVMPAEGLVDRRLVGAELEAVAEVKLAAGADALELARKGSKWHMRAPVDREVDADIGRDFVESLLALEATSLAPPGASITNARSHARVISTTESILSDAGDGDRIEELEVGPEEKGGVVYVRRVEDGALLEVPADRAAALFPSDVALRSHTLWNEPVKRFRSLTIKDGDRTQRLRRTDEGGWELLEPKGRGITADIGLATDVADMLGSLKAERWVPVKSADENAQNAFGLNPPRMVIEAELGDEDAPPDGDGNRRTLKLLLGAPAVVGSASAGSFARTGDDPAVFIAPKRLESAASRWLISRSALVVEPASVLRATLEGASGAKIELERSPTGSFMVVDGKKKPSVGPPLVSKAAAIRDMLGDLMAEGAVSLGKPDESEGFKKPSIILSIEREGALDAAGKPKRETVRILFGAGDVWRGTNIRYARRDGIEATYAVAQAKVRPLFEALGED